MSLRISLLALFTAFLAVTTSQKCYGLDGTALDNTFAPCNSSAKYSGCCATNRTTGSPDICLDNGLCMATNNELVGTIWQSGCTDPTGKDVACPRLCPDVTTNFGGLNPVSSWNLQTCDLGKYCCRAINDRRSCCNNATAPRITTSSIGILLLQTSTIGAPSSNPTPVSTTSDPTLIVATAVPTAAPSVDSCKTERHKTAVVGGTIGGLFGAIIVGLAGTIFWMYKREQRQRKLKEHYEEQFSQTWAYRKTLASSAASLRHSTLVEEMHFKTIGPT